MAATALIRFRRDNNTPTTFPNGQAILGSIGDQIRVWNSDNLGVQSWQVDLVYTPPDSLIPVATPLIFSDASSTPDSGVVTLDATGGYRFVLKVWDVPNRIGVPTDVDIRNVLVPEASGFISPASAFWPQPLPPPQSLLPEAKPEENNIGGQAHGWAGTGADGLLTHLIRVAAAGVPLIDLRFEDAVITQTLRIPGTISPAQITANQNDYNPAGLADATVVRVTTDASRTLTGLAGGAAGRLIIIRNVGSFDLVLAPEDVGSSANNRFSIGTAITVLPTRSVTLMWDVTLSRWTAFALPSFIVADDSITFAKIQNITTDRLLGRDTAGSGDTEEIAVTDGLAFTGSASIGIANQGVTFARMQNINTDRLIGRDTASTGSPEEVSVTNGLEFTGGPAIGIANQGVTFARMQNLAASRLLGRGSSGSGSPEEISLNARLSLVGSTLTLAANGIDNTVLAQMATLTLKGNNTGGTANAADLTVAQVQTMLRDSWTYLGFAGTVPTTGLLRLPYPATIFVGKDSGAADRTLMSYGVTGTNELQVGNSGGSQFNMVFTNSDGLFYDGGSPRFFILGSDNLVRNYLSGYAFDSGVANPILSQTNVASGGGNPLTVRARGSTGASNAGSDLRLEPGRPGAGGTAGVGRLRGNRDDSTFDEAFAWDTSGSAARLGFYGATPAVKPAAITGTRADGTALADLLTKLATLGLISDSSSAGASSGDRIYAAFHRGSVSGGTTEVGINYDRVLFDLYNCVDYFDAAATFINPPVAGYYLIWAQTSALAATITNTELNIEVGGAVVAAASSNGGPNMSGVCLFWGGLLNEDRYQILRDLSTTANTDTWTGLERLSDVASSSNSLCLVARQTTSSTTEAAIGFDDPDIIDTHAYHDPVTNNTRLTAPATGIYEAWACVSSLAANASNEVGIRQDGTTMRGHGSCDTPSTGSSGTMAFALVSLTAGQYLEMVCDAETATARYYRFFMRRLDGTGESLCAAVITGLTSTLTEAAIAFSAADLVDTDNYHNPASNNTQFVAPTTGIYEFIGNVSGPVGTTVEIILRKNGATDVAASANNDPPAAYNTNGATVIWSGLLLAGEYIEIRLDWGTSSVANFWAQALMRRRYNK
jgi:hypothetical protein